MSLSKPYDTNNNSDNKKVRYFHLHHTLTFGKYKGGVVKQVIIEDPDYMRWCVENIEWMRLDAKAQDFLDAQPQPQIKESTINESIYDRIDKDFGFKY